MGLLVLVFLLCVIISGYVKAVRQVKKGHLTVYKDWRDFGWSVAWLFCLVAGFVFLVLGSVSKSWHFVFYLIAIACGVITVISFIHLIRGAFLLNKDRHDAWLSLFARFVGGVFTVGLIGLIWLEDDDDARRNPNLVMELLWILFYCWLFKTCLLPLIKDNGMGIVAENHPKKTRSSTRMNSRRCVKAFRRVKMD